MQQETTQDNGQTKVLWIDSKQAPYGLQAHSILHLLKTYANDALLKIWDNSKANQTHSLSAVSVPDAVIEQDGKTYRRYPFMMTVNGYITEANLQSFVHILNNAAEVGDIHGPAFIPPLVMELAITMPIPRFILVAYVYSTLSLGELKEKYPVEEEGALPSKPALEGFRRMPTIEEYEAMPRAVQVFSEYDFVQGWTWLQHKTGYPFAAFMNPGEAHMYREKHCPDAILQGSGYITPLQLSTGRTETLMNILASIQRDFRVTDTEMEEVVKKLYSKEPHVNP